MMNGETALSRYLSKWKSSRIPELKFLISYGADIDLANNMMIAPRVLLEQYGLHNLISLFDNKSMHNISIFSFDDTFINKFYYKQLIEQKINKIFTFLLVPAALSILSLYRSDRLFIK